MEEQLLEFPKTEIDPNLLKLQEKVYEFTVSVILKHEMKFFELASKMNRLDIVNTTNQTIIDMIMIATNDFYNMCYFTMQNNNDIPIRNVIKEMDELTDYGWWILLDKLIRLTIDAHIDIVREDIIVDSSDLYNESVYNQLYDYLCDKNVIHIFSKGCDDDIEFTFVSDGNKPFDIVIDKKII